MKYDILLLNPPSRSVNHYRPPLNLAYLGGFLRRKGKAVKVVDHPVKENIRNKDFFENIDRYICESWLATLNDIFYTEYEYIGISCCSTEVKEVKDLIMTIRKSNGTHKIIVGGIHPTLYPQDFYGIADIIVRGEGEVALGMILDNHVQKGVVEADIENIDVISYPDYSFFDMDYYTSPNPYAIRGVFIRPVYISCGRGCPSQCSFCVAPTLRHHFGFGRMRRPLNIVRELAELKQTYHPDGFYIIDDLFTQSDEYVREFCEVLSQAKLKMLWGCNAKVSTVTYRMLQSMAQTGCVQIDFGIERGSDEELMRIKKYQTISSCRKVFGWCKELRIRTFANFLVGMSGEKAQHLKDIRRLAEELQPTLSSFNVYTSYPGTQLPEGGNKKRLNKWANLCNKRYNRINHALRFHTGKKYISTVSKSHKLPSYFFKAGELAAETVNQLF